MDTTSIVGLLQESFFMILVFAFFLIFSMIRGRQALVNTILGLYLALLVSLKFPYYEQILTGGGAGNAFIMITVFVALTALGTILFGRLMPRDPMEPAFAMFNRKILFAIMATILVMAYSYHVLPVTEIITPGSPIQALFAPEERFFWWLTLPLIALFFL